MRRPSLERTVALSLSARVLDKAFLRTRISREIETAASRARRFGGAWFRYSRDVKKRLSYEVLTCWYAFVTLRPRRALSPERIQELEEVTDGYIEWLEDQELGTKHSLRRLASLWSFQVNVLGDALRLFLLHCLQHQDRGSTGLPRHLTSDIWWRIRAFIWLEANNPLLED